MIAKGTTIVAAALAGILTSCGTHGNCSAGTCTKTTDQAAKSGCAGKSGCNAKKGCEGKKGCNSKSGCEGKSH